MGYVTLRPTEMRDGSIRDAGLPIPEASEWDNPGAWVQTGQIALVPDGKEDAFKDALDAGKSVSHLAPSSNLFHLQIAAATVGQVGMSDVTDSPNQKPFASGDVIASSSADAAAVPVSPENLSLSAGDGAPPVQPQATLAVDDGPLSDSDTDTEEVVEDAAVSPTDDPTAPKKPVIRRVRKVRR